MAETGRPSDYGQYLDECFDLATLRPFKEYAVWKAEKSAAARPTFAYAPPGELYSVGDRITKDGRPGIVTGWHESPDTVDITLIDGTETFVRTPDYAQRVRKIAGGQP